MRFNTQQKIFWALYLVLILANLFVDFIIFCIGTIYQEDITELLWSPVGFHAIFGLISVFLAFYSLFKKSFTSSFEKILLIYFVLVVPYMYEFIFNDDEPLLAIALIFSTPLPLMFVKLLCGRRANVK